MFLKTVATIAYKYQLANLENKYNRYMNMFMFVMFVHQLPINQ